MGDAARDLNVSVVTVSKVGSEPPGYDSGALGFDKASDG
jgi:hypothetical protein